MDTITALLRNNCIKAENDGIAITVLDRTEEELTGYLKKVAKESIEALELARTIRNKPSAKYDNFLSEDLMCADYLSSKMDLEGAQYMLKQIIGAH